MKGQYILTVVGLIILSRVTYQSTEIPSQYLDLKTCVIVFISPGDANRTEKETSLCDNIKHEACELSSKVTCESLYAAISKVFSSENKVRTVYKRDVTKDWLLDSLSKQRNDTRFSECSIAVYPKPVKDRTCLLSPLKPAPHPTTINITRMSHDNVIESVNQLCHTFRNVHGHLDRKGLHEAYIKHNLFSVKSLSNHVKSHTVFTDSKPPLKILPECERLSINSWEQFYNDHLQISKPVVITNASSMWNASRLWTNQYLVERYGNKSVHIKLSPTSDYEGIESGELWENFDLFRIPSEVRSQLEFPDLVVPRPATTNMKFAEYIELMENIAGKKVDNISAYLEYSSIRQYFPELEDDISEMTFIESNLKLKHLNIWLSDGNTLGKLHFDPFDNFLCMIDGRKELVLFEPHNNHMLYESHIPEAEFSVDLKGYRFRRKKLLESTSMVMSPFDIRKPDFQKFPAFGESMPLNCTIDEGDVLFMPAFWWHEVQSFPSKTRKRNLAVNYWYEPFLTKEFPCRECKLEVNPYYNNLL